MAMISAFTTIDKTAHNSQASFRHVQGTTSRDLWLSFEKAYAPHSTSREYTLKTQLLRIEMHGDETPDAYLNCAQEYADALAAIGEPVRIKISLCLLSQVFVKNITVLKLRSLHIKVQLHLASFMHSLVIMIICLEKLVHQLPSITSSFAANYAVGSQSMPEARQAQLSELTAQLSALGFQVSPIAPSGPQAFYGVRPSNNRNNNNNNRGNRINSRGNNNRGRGNGRQFDRASTQNTVYGTCNRCCIGHIPSQCSNRDPSIIRTRPSANFANTRAQSSNASANWHSDTGANSHVTPDLEAMDNSEAYYGDDALHVGNDESTHTTLLTGPSKHGLYTITLPQLKSINKVSFLVVQASPTIWHRRLGHPHRLLRSMLSNFSLPVTNKSLSRLCNSCPLGKSSKLPLFEYGFRSNNILDLVYCDVWGPAPLLSFEGHRNFLLCVDHHSRYMWIYHLAQKFDVYSTFKSFVQMVERQFTTKLKNVQTDWGGEFRNLVSFFSSLGIIHRRSCPHTSGQNGFVERRNRHVVETGLTLLAQACVPQRFLALCF
nr:hypothetical protein [Tanacetum cinerariifolium]